MKLDNFDGSCTPVQVADWLSYVEDKMEAFEFERRFYPATFLDKMKLDLNNYVQDKKTVAEYEIGFNQIVRFVPHVAHDEVEKARQFCQGLKPTIRHVLGAFSITDFCSMVEQALGVKMQLMYTIDLYKSSGGEQSRSQGDRKGHSGGPSHKKGKSQRHHAYRGSSTQSRTSGGTTPQYRAIPKPGMWMEESRCQASMGASVFFFGF
ncbi:hypothetical protein E2562_016104 [Oryza meyeriana var. granulata]|uniref:Retrotransposon gag domain-containing protein n=1 Tax=Oryza meyeriana var. granulata TaxID=110450 RepID=A0A6G1BL67_9ORYZ|nr:hypothetical protein E2562_016104 [Oryza meyeriana var. granulata]